MRSLRLFADVDSLPEASRVIFPDSVLKCSETCKRPVGILEIISGYTTSLSVETGGEFRAEKSHVYTCSHRSAGNAVPSIYRTDVIDGFSSLLPGAQLRLRRENRNARTEDLPEAARPQ